MTVLPPLDNEYVKNLHQPAGDVGFHRTVIDQLRKSRTSILDDICLETSLPDYTDIRSAHLLAKGSVTSEKLVTWLETVFCNLDQYAMPWLEKAAPLAEELGKLKDENISDRDQETIINLR